MTNLLNKNYPTVNYSLTKKVFTLKRNEILRGFKSFDKVFKDGRQVRNVNIVAFVQKLDTPTGFPVRAGFFLSKKKLKNLTTATG